MTRRGTDRLRSAGNLYRVLPWLLVLACASAQAASPLERNGFSLQPSLIPLDQILRGGPARDGIPALDRPSVEPAASTGWKDEDLVVGIVNGGEARAYPGDEVARAGGRVEDRFSGQRIVVNYDPATKRFDHRVPAGIEVVEGFWFAWMAFHPDSDVFEAPRISK